MEMCDGRGGLRKGLLERNGTTHLDNDEAGTGRVSAGKVDAALVVGDIETLDSSLGSADEAGEGREDGEGLHDADFFWCREDDDAERVEDWRSQDRGD